MAAYATDTSFLSRRAIVFFAIVAFHVFIVWALASGLARKVVETIAPPIETDIIEELEQREEPPPPPPPEMERPPVEVPPPEVSIDIPMETSTAIQDVTDRPPPPRPPPPPRVVQRTAPTVDLKRSPSTDDYYPPASRRANEEGVSTIRTCVSPEGRSTGTAEIAKSSGHPRLDEAAVKWAQRARFKPGTEDGKPVESCTSFNVRFRLTD